MWFYKEVDFSKYIGTNDCGALYFTPDVEDEERKGMDEALKRGGIQEMLKYVRDNGGFTLSAN